MCLYLLLPLLGGASLSASEVCDFHPHFQTWCSIQFVFIPWQLHDLDQDRKAIQFYLGHLPSSGGVSDKFLDENSEFKKCVHRDRHQISNCLQTTMTIDKLLFFQFLSSIWKETSMYIMKRSLYMECFKPIQCKYYNGFSCTYHPVQQLSTSAILISFPLHFLPSPTQ